VIFLLPLHVTFGGALRAEIIPFEPDPGNTGEGKKSLSTSHNFPLYSYSGFSANMPNLLYV